MASNDQHISNHKSSNSRYGGHFNITERIMQGLMFTIKQDKNGVTISEHMSKLELNEIFENSKMIEQKENNCLIHSNQPVQEIIVTPKHKPVRLPKKSKNLLQNTLIAFRKLRQDLKIKNEDKPNQMDGSQLDAECENAVSLNCWPRLFKNKSLFGSINPNHGKAFDNADIDTDVKLKMEDGYEQVLQEKYITSKVQVNNALSRTHEATKTFSTNAFNGILKRNKKQNDQSISYKNYHTEIKKINCFLALNYDNLIDNSLKLREVMISNEIITNYHTTSILSNVTRDKFFIGQRYTTKEIININVKFENVQDENIRITRSKAKLYAQSNRILLSACNEKPSKRQNFLPTKIKRSLYNSHNKQVHRDPLHKTVVNRRRIRKSINNTKSKASKTEDKRITINIQKLISDLTYGIMIIVERFD